MIFFRETTSPEEFKGLRYRMAGPGAEVLRRLGAIVVTLPGGEIMPSLRSGAIDASEWIGPWLDMALGLHKVATYCYYPGFHEPGSGLTLGINRRLWESLDTSDRRILEDASTAEYLRSVAEFNANNASQAARRRQGQDPEIRRLHPPRIPAPQPGRRGGRGLRRRAGAVRSLTRARPSG